MDYLIVGVEQLLKFCGADGLFCGADVSIKTAHALAIL